MSSNLSYALTKIQFGQITDSKFTERSDSLIESLGEEYPIFVSRKVEQIEVTFDNNTHEQKSVKTNIPIITLLSGDEEWGVRITKDYLLIHTAYYSNYENFEARASFILNKIKEIMEIRHLAFIGLRYLNKFDEENFTANFKRSEFLQPNFDIFSMAGSNMASRYIDGKYGININSGIIVNNLKYPSDIIELLNDIKVKNEVLSGAWAHLDIDVYSAEKKLIPFEHDYIIKTLKELRARAKKVYTDIVED